MVTIETIVILRGCKLPYFIYLVSNQINKAEQLPQVLFPDIYPAILNFTNGVPLFMTANERAINLNFTAFKTVPWDFPSFLFRL